MGTKLFDKDSEFFEKCDKVLTEEFNNRNKYQSHPYTDVYALKNQFDISCINFAVGYYNYHTKHEYVIVEDVYNTLGIVPEFISTYNSRKFAFPHLVQQNDKGKFFLFGGLPKDIDKKKVIWELVAKREPQITWQYTKNNTLKKENFDQTDACAALGLMKMKEIW